MKIFIRMHYLKREKFLVKGFKIRHLHNSFQNLRGEIVFTAHTVGKTNLCLGHDTFVILF
jgi:hypothetical protein